MATELTYGEAWDLIAVIVQILEALDGFANANTPNFADLQDDLIAENVGAYPVDVMRGVLDMRARLNETLTEDAVRAVLQPAMWEMGKAIGAPDYDSVAQVYERLREYMIANSETINGRGLTYGTITADGGNTGTGTIHELTTGPDGTDLQGATAETVTYEVTRDQNMGADKHAEIIEYRGQDASVDWLELQGSGIVEQITALDVRETERWIQNPGFDVYGGTTQPATSSEVEPTATTSVTGWTLSAVNAFKVSVDVTFSTPQGVSAPKSLRCIAAGTATQVLSATKRVAYDRYVPMHLEIQVYRKDACDRSFKLEIGNVSKTVSGADLDDAAWNRVAIDLDEDCWPENIIKDGLSVVLTVSGGTTGSFYVDNTLHGQMRRVDGRWLCPVGGATPFKRGDTWTQTISAPTARAKHAYWIDYRAGFGRDQGLSLPNDVLGAETVSDPT